MASKLCFLLLGLCALVAVIQAAPKRSKQSEIALKTFAKRSLKSKRDDDEEFTREEFIEFLKQLTPEDVENLTDEEKVGIIFLIYLFEIQPHEIEKRNALVNVVKRSVMKKRDDDELTREEFIAFLNSLTKEDIQKLTEEEKMGLIFLILLFDVQEDEIHIQKRETFDYGYDSNDYYVDKSASKQIAKRSLQARETLDYGYDSNDYYVDESASKQIAKRSLQARNYDYDYKVEGKLSLKGVIKRSLSKRESEEFTREEFIKFLKTLKPEDLEKLTDEEKLGLIFLIYVFEVEPHELEKRFIN